MFKKIRIDVSNTCASVSRANRTDDSHVRKLCQISRLEIVAPTSQFSGVLGNSDSWGSQMTISGRNIKRRPHWSRF